MQQLKGLHTDDGRQLSLRLNAEIVRELQRLELVLGMIETIEAERDAIASAKTKVEHSNAKKIQDLVKVKSIGPEFATALVSEVFYRSFDNRSAPSDNSVAMLHRCNAGSSVSDGFQGAALERYAALAASTYIRLGASPLVPRSLLQQCEGIGLQGGWDHSFYICEATPQTDEAC